MSDKALTASPIVTVPALPGAAPLAQVAPITAPQLPPAPVRFPLGWLLANATGPIRYRSVVDVARLPLPSGVRLDTLVYTHPAALALAFTQRGDGSWSHAMLTLPPSRAEGFEGVGTIPAYRRLLEYGWERDAPPLAHARRTLFRLLAEDDDPAVLWEMMPRSGKLEPEVGHHGRTLLREAAAAALAQGGYEGDPRLRGAAQRIVERISAFLRSPFAQKPFVRVGNQHVITSEFAPPSIYALTMLAYMPLFRSERHDIMDRLYQHVIQPLPRAEPVQLVGKKVVPAPQLVLGDMLPHRNAVDADVPWALHWLELMARLGFLRRNEGWTKLFDRFIDDRDSEGVWHPHKGMAAPRSTNPFVWSSHPLEESGEGEARWSDVTFRIGLIARLGGRPIDLV
ncbi:MAG: hypothetical protein NVS1B4_03270 [Gemmatimonadaceae bacterium]